MSYKYLYGFTNDLSYDFTKVIYFGKQDRAEPELNRVIEHYRDSDINHDEFQAAKYLLFSKIDTGVDLSDLEAYFIQTYRPKLNTVYNPDYVKTVKLSPKETEAIKPIANSLTWYCANLHAGEISRIERTIERITKRNTAIEGAVHIFESREKLLSMPFSELHELVSGGYAVIRPRIANSLIDPLLKVYVEKDCLRICNSESRGCFNDPKNEYIDYKEILKNICFPEVGMTETKNLITRTSREYAHEEMKETVEWKELTQDLYNIWRNMLYIYSKKLEEQEPEYCKNVCFADFFDEDFYRYVGPGYNSKNEYLIEHIKAAFYNHEEEILGFKNIHIGELFTGKFNLEKTFYQGISNFISDYENIDEKEKNSIDKTIAEWELKPWIRNIEKMAENHELHWCNDNEN